MKVLYISLAVIFTDQITKFLVKGLKAEWLGLNIEGMPYGSSKPLLGDFARITFIENPGMAFGLDVGPKMFLTLFTIAASLVIFFYIYKHRNDGFLLRLSLSFILAGAVGNLIDRTFYGKIYSYAPFFYGRVVDFIQVEFWDFTFLGRTYTTWPIFNIADVSVTIGFFIILLFHKKIFHTQQPEHGGNGSRPEEVLAPNGASDENKGSESNLIKIENSKENPYPGSSRTEEAKD